MSSVKDKLIEACLVTMRDKGYEGTKVAEICAAAGVSKGGFYHFFKTKEDLALAAVRVFHQRGIATLMSGFVESDDPIERAMGFLDHMIERGPLLWENGCLLGSFATELTKSNALHVEVGKLFGEMKQGLWFVFDPFAQAVGPPCPPGEDLALQFLAVVEGSVVLCMAQSDPEVIRRSLKTFRRFLELLAGARQT